MRLGGDKFSILFDNTLRTLIISPAGDCRKIEFLLSVHLALCALWFLSKSLWTAQKSYFLERRRVNVGSSY